MSDVRAAVHELRDRGVRFEDNDLGLKTDDSIATTGDFQEAWFRDPDGNVLRTHSQIEI